MPGFKRPTSERKPQSSGGYNRGGSNKSSSDDEFARTKVSGLFRREGKYGEFWVSGLVDGDQEYTLSYNKGYDEDPEKQPMYLLYKGKSRIADKK